MNEIVKVYKNSPVRIVEKGGEPWFVARDVCKVLEITKVDSAIRNLDADEKGRAFFYFLQKFSPPQNGEFFESQKEEHFHFSKNSP